MENNISERISVGSRQTSITRTSQYSKHLAIETQSQSSESSRTSGYGSFTNGSVPNGHQISVAIKPIAVFVRWSRHRFDTEQGIGHITSE